MDHWSETKEKGGLWQLRFMLFLYRKLGIARIRAILYPVVFFFFVFAPGVRKVSKSFLLRVAKAKEPANANVAVPRGEVFRHIHSFAVALIEKVAAWSKHITAADLDTQPGDRDEFETQVASGGGALILCSHLGNVEMLRALASIEFPQRHEGLRINSIVEFSGTSKFNRLLEEIDPGAMLNLIPASSIGPDTIIDLKDRVAAGELVIIAGDRTAAANRNKTGKVSFVGDTAYFPQGAFILASLMDTPIYFMFALRHDDMDLSSRYDLFVYKAKQDMTGSRRERMVKIQALMEEYVGHLERLCIEHPLQWYNFYDFWKNPGTEAPERPAAQR